MSGPTPCLPTVGGQTALNLTVELGRERGVLEKYGVKLIGANLDGDPEGGGSLAFKEAMAAHRGLETPRSGTAQTWTRRGRCRRDRPSR